MKMNDSVSLGLSPPEEKNVHFNTTSSEVNESESTIKEDNISPNNKELGSQNAKNDNKAILSPFGNGKDTKMDQIWRKSKLFSPSV